jgi:CubicO group peptidase (beta-lactamase class C family)
VASAGKFITHIAALQCVERGLITLDEPIYSHLPELDNLKVISQNQGSNASTRPFLLRSPTKKITLHHLLSHSSGIVQECTPLIQKWRASNGEKPKGNYSPYMDFQVKDYRPHEEAFSTPLLFEPGEGWVYGASLGWTSLLVSRLTNQTLGKYIQENIFNPLGMTSSLYDPQNHPYISSRILQMVRREGGTLLPANYPLRELVSSVSDLGLLLSDLMSPSKLLKQENLDLVFAPQFAPSSSALSYIRHGTENYAAPAGIPISQTEAPVNHSLAALVVEEELSLSHMPAGTVTWNGMPNVIWAMNREKGLGMIFATQLLPVDDENTVDLAMAFMRGAWDTFG